MRRDWKTVLVVAALFAVTASLFWPATGYDYVDFDDGSYVFENPWVNTGLPWKNVRWAFAAVHEDWWLPVLWLSFMVDTELFGPGPFGYHLTNILLHALNTVLLFWVLHRMTGMRWRSAWVAAFFAIHPLRVESVVWITERKDVLSGLFWMLAMLAYLRYVENPTRRRYWLVPALMLLGLMSKAILIVLPPVLLLLDYWPLRRAGSPFQRSQWPAWWRLFVEKTPLWVLSLMFIGINLKTHTEGVGFLYQQFVARLWLIFPNYWKYLAKIFWPGRMGILYPERDIVYVPASLLALGGLAVITLLAFWLSRRYRFVGMGWLWFLVVLSPVIRGVRLGLAEYADRFTYLPSIGLGILLVWAVAEWAGAARRRRALALCAAALLLAAAGSLTARQIRLWENSETLFRHTLNITGPNPIILNNLGSYMLEKGQLQDAEKLFHEVLVIAPSFSLSQANLGATYCLMGRFEKATEHLRAALKLEPAYKTAILNLGGALYMLGRFNEAIDEFKRVSVLDPKAAAAHYNIGNAYYELGRFEQAIAQYREALRLQPKYIAAQGNMGNAFFRMGRTNEALAAYRGAMGMNSNHFDTVRNAADVLQAMGRMDEALEHYQRAAELQPTNALAHLGMGRISLARQREEEARISFDRALRYETNLTAYIITEGDRLFKQTFFNEAADRYREALFINPSNSLAHHNLANALVKLGHLPEAVTQFEEALRLDPEYPLARFNLGNALFELGRMEEAVSQYREALRLDPENLSAAINMGRAFCARGRFEDGIEQFRYAMDRDPDNLSAVINMENALLELGRADEARDLAERALVLARKQGGEQQAAQTRTRLGSLQQAASQDGN